MPPEIYVASLQTSGDKCTRCRRLYVQIVVRGQHGKDSVAKTDGQIFHLPHRLVGHIAQVNMRAHECLVPLRINLHLESGALHEQVAGSTANSLLYGRGALYGDIQGGRVSR